MSWKPALYEYVSAANARETEPVAAESLLPAERARLRRLAASYADRGASPVGCDTRLRITRQREGEREVVVDLELQRTMYVRTRGVEHAEQRIDRERVAVQRSPDGEWTVSRAEPIVEERHAGAGPAAVYGEAGPAVRTAPFLNERVLVRAYPERWERSSVYDREAARAYAERHWNDPNPQFVHFDIDCTNYVSQCLYAGGAPMNFGVGRESGWWYRGRSGGREQWSFSWSVAHSLHWYLMTGRNEGLAADRVAEPKELTIGDVILYDFDGDGRFEHSAVVTGADGAGMPLVNAHTTNSRARYWDYRDSYAWTDRTVYRFFRIRNRF